MSKPVPIIVPRENVNDESAMLICWSSEDGKTVDEGAFVAQIETSKAVVEIPAPATGVLRHAARAGQEVALGSILGWIGAEVTSLKPSPLDGTNADVTACGSTNLSVPRSELWEGLAAPPFSKTESVRGLIVPHDRANQAVDPQPGDPGVHSQGEAAHEPEIKLPTRLSRKARELIQSLGLDEQMFKGRGLVRSRDIVHASANGRAVVEPNPVETPPVRRRPGREGQVVARSEPLSRSKKTEGKHLRLGSQSVLPSVVTITCPTRGLRRRRGSPVRSSGQRDRHHLVRGRSTAAEISCL